MGRGSSPAHVFLSLAGASFLFAMEAAQWTAIGLVTAFAFGSLFYLGSRIDTLGSRTDALGARLDARLHHLATRIDALASRLDAHLERHAG